MQFKGKFKAAYLTSSLFEGINREQLYREQKYVWDHARFEYYRYFSAMPNFRGRYISTDENGFRTTVQHLKDKDLPLKNVAIFGTSTIWGGPSGADEYTVPSLLAKELNDRVDNLNFHVKNFAVGAYTCTQELILFIEQIENEKIDIAVFVDGASEFLRSYDELASNAPKKRFLMPDKRYIQFGIYNSGLLPRYATLFPEFKKSPVGRRLRSVTDRLPRLHRKQFENNGNGRALDESGIMAQVERTVKLYLKNKRIIEAIAKEFEIQVKFFLEPWLFTKNNLSREESQLLQRIAENKIYTKFTKECISAFQTEFGRQRNCLDLTNIFNTDATIFIDEHHMSKNGNSIMARHIANSIIAMLM